MKVKCINKGNWYDITKDKIYEVSKKEVNSHSYWKEERYLITNDEGSLVNYEKSLFEIVKEDNMFNWDGFLKGKILVQLDNKEAWDDFTKECDDRNIKFYYKYSEDYYNFAEYCTDKDGGYIYRVKRNSKKLKSHKVVKWIINKPTIKSTLVYLILDVSGSIDEDKKSEYTKMYNKLKLENKKVKIITHTTVAQFNTIDLKVEWGGGTYMSSGLGLALQDMIANDYKNSFDNIKVIQMGDGENWSEDNKRLYNLIKNLLNNGVDYQYYEVNPSDYTTPMSQKLTKEIEGIYNRIHIVKTEQKFPTKIYQVEHNVDGKLYDFVNSNETLTVGQMVCCNTCKGNTYGKIKNIEIKDMTKSKINEYKECRRIV